MSERRKKGHRSVPPPFQVHFKSVPYGCKLLGNQKGTTALKQNDFKLMIYSLMFTLQTTARMANEQFGTMVQ